MPAAVTVMATTHTTVLCQAVVLLGQQVLIANGSDMVTRRDRAPREVERRSHANLHICIEAS